MPKWKLNEVPDHVKSKICAIGRNFYQGYSFGYYRADASKWDTYTGNHCSLAKVPFSGTKAFTEFGKFAPRQALENDVIVICVPRDGNTDWFIMPVQYFIPGFTVTITSMMGSYTSKTLSLANGSIGFTKMPGTGGDNCVYMNSFEIGAVLFGDASLFDNFYAEVCKGIFGFQKYEHFNLLIPKQEEFIADRNYMANALTLTVRDLSSIDSDPLAYIQTPLLNPRKIGIIQKMGGGYLIHDNRPVENEWWPINHPPEKDITRIAISRTGILHLCPRSGAKSGQSIVIREKDYPYLYQFLRDVYKA